MDPGNDPSQPDSMPCALWVLPHLPSPPRRQNPRLGPSTTPRGKQTLDGGLAEWSCSTGSQRGGGKVWGLYPSHNAQSPGCLGPTTETWAGFLAGASLGLRNEARPRNTEHRCSSPTPHPPSQTACGGWEGRRGQRCGVHGQQHRTPAVLCDVRGACNTPKPGALRAQT